MNQIHLLIPCTSRKIRNASITMNVKEHTSGSLEETLHKWERTFSTSQNRTKAKDLYTGPGFTNLRALAEKHGLLLKILSAGFGLIDGETELPLYNATFAANENRVPGPKSRWWQAVNESTLPGMSLQKTFSNHQNDYFIVVASIEYLQAIQYDLLETLKRFNSASKQIAIISSSIPKPLNDFAKCFVQCSHDVLEHPYASGTGLSLTNRNLGAIASHLFLSKLDLTKPDFNDTICDLNKEFTKLTRKTKVERPKQTDKFVIEFIENQILIDGKTQLSITKAHKRFRDAGYACEDKRFSNLYKQVKSEKGLS
ncbi:TPA: hypothetical protein RQJ54_001518 [Vibrio vulnificus]|nr:hypothetical protein [Vibrio parahaemolyticus]HAV6897838.1 hypothetical protein [Vibrio vulnificus]HDY7436608.1 hypothetical protein [Vibrio vulnificus]HDY7523626.1 hypothetical protein [Vibrio vulnificus]